MGLINFHMRVYVNLMNLETMSHNKKGSRRKSNTSVITHRFFFFEIKKSNGKLLTGNLTIKLFISI